MHFFNIEIQYAQPLGEHVQIGDVFGSLLATLAFPMLTGFSYFFNRVVDLLHDPFQGEEFRLILLRIQFQLLNSLILFDYLCS